MEIKNNILLTHDCESQFSEGFCREAFVLLQRLVVWNDSSDVRSHKASLSQSLDLDPTAFSPW